MINLLLENGQQVITIFQEHFFRDKSEKYNLMCRDIIGC